MKSESLLFYFSQSRSPSCIYFFVAISIIQRHFSLGKCVGTCRQAEKSEGVKNAYQINDAYLRTV